jgi:hypothetical protein
LKEFEAAGADSDRLLALLPAGLQAKKEPGRL